MVGIYSTGTCKIRGIRKVFPKLFLCIAYYSPSLFDDSPEMFCKIQCKCTTYKRLCLLIAETLLEHKLIVHFQSYNILAVVKFWPFIFVPNILNTT